LLAFTCVVGFLSAPVPAAHAAGNSPPVVNSVTISPSSATTNKTLTATIDATDPDGDTLSYSYQWFKNGNPLAGESNQTLDLSVSGNGDKGDVITVQGTASDGLGGSDSKTSDPLTIGDSRPVAKPDGPYVAHGATTLSVSEPGVLANDTDADGDKLTVTARSPIDGPSHGKLTLNSDGSFSYRPAAGVCNRSDSFTYRAKDGTLRSGQATASITVKTQLRSTTLTLKRSATRIVYGRSVFLKAHLSAFSASARISIYGTPYGGTRKLLARGRPGKRGNLGVHVRPSRLTSYRAFSTDNCFVAGDSGAQRVQVAPLVQGHMVGFFARKSPYALYHAGGRAPHYHGSVTPNHSGRNVTFTWQRMAGGSWTGYLRTTLQLNDNSAVDVYMTKGVVKGVPYRVRIVFLRDADHLSHTGPWSYFKAV
jgi:VCBS repeat-containing protein